MKLMSPLKSGPAELGFDAIEPESTITPGWKLKSTSAFTYPLIVTPETEVWTKDNFSSALAREINPPKQMTEIVIKPTDMPKFFLILFPISSRMLIFYNGFTMFCFTMFLNLSGLTLLNHKPLRTE